MKKKIDIVTRHFWPNNLTLLSRAIYEVFLRLNSRYSFTVHTDQNPYLKTETKLNTLIIRPNKRLSSFKVLDDSDIIHFWGSLNGAYLFLRTLNHKNKNVPIILSLYTSKLNWGDFFYLRATDFIHDKKVWFLYPLIGAFIPNFIFKRELKKVSYLIISDKRGERFYRKMLGEKVIRIPHGVDTKKFKPISKEKARQEIGLRTAKRIILFVGHSYLVKGVDTIIYATELLLKRIPNPNILLVLLLNPMPNSPISFIKNLAYKHLGNNVKIIVKNVKDIEYYYNAADVIVLPFRYNIGFSRYPFVLLESMACAKPIVTSKIGVIPEIIEDRYNGLLTSPNDVRELSDAIIEILTDEKLAYKLGQNASESVKEFDWGIVANKVLKIYKEVLNEK